MIRVQPDTFHTRQPQRPREGPFAFLRRVARRDQRVKVAVDLARILADGALWSAAGVQLEAPRELPGLFEPA